jgi:large subunit ribosomal protein L28
MDLVMRERKCDITGARRNANAMSVSKSNAHTHRVQNVNLQVKKLWWEEGNKFVRVRIATRTLKTIQKNGLDKTAKKYGIDLNKYAMSYGGVRTPAVSESGAGEKKEKKELTIV